MTCDVHATDQDSFSLPHDTVPNFAKSPTIESVQSGPWTSVSTWSLGRVPTVNDIVRIKANTIVTYDEYSNNLIKAIGIEDEASLKFKNDINTRLKVSTLQVYPGGYLEIGTETTPIFSNKIAEIIFDGQFESFDPNQYGIGLLNIDGKITMYGAKKTPTFSRVTVEPKVNDSTLVLLEPAIGWKVGDQLIVPDTRQLGTGNNRHDYLSNHQNERVTISSISPDGRTISLNNALAFDHIGARNQITGELVALPHVANLSRNVVLKSANPTGVRGHTQNFRRSDVNIQNVSFLDLGRTRAKEDNIIGRYMLHFHHVWGPTITPANGYQVTAVGNVFDGKDQAFDIGVRWGLTIHGTHYGLFKDNIAYALYGACIATEDGSESFNRIEHNFAAKCIGTGGDRHSNNAGDSLWLKGPNNYVNNNALYGGYNFSDSDHMLVDIGSNIKYAVKDTGNVKIPNFKGADMMNPANYTVKNASDIPILQNIGNSLWHSTNGFVLWEVGSQGDMPTPNMPESLIKDMEIVHTFNRGMFMYKHQNIIFENLKVWMTPTGDLSRCGVSGDYAAYGLSFINSHFHGCKEGYKVTSWGTQTSFINTTIDAKDKNIQVRVGYSTNGSQHIPDYNEIILSNVKLNPLPNSPSSADALFTNYGTNKTNIARFTEIKVFDYQGVQDNNFKVFFPEQAPDHPMPQTERDQLPGRDFVGCPSTGMTNQQCWNAHAVATHGELATCSNGTQYSEIRGFTCPIAGSGPDTLAPAPPRGLRERI